MARRGYVVQAAEARSARVESLRALAAVAVLLGHVYGFAVGFAPTPFSHRLGLSGGYGVWLFFALSGYLLFWPFVRRDYGGGDPIDLGRYALNRVLRILPLYYVVLVVLLVLNESGGSATQWLRFGTFTQSFFSDTVATVNGPMWSLVVEIQFYALLPLLAWLLARVSRGSAAVAAAGVAALGALSLGVWYFKVHRLAGADDRWRYSLAATFVAFTPGMLLAIARARLEARAHPLRLPAGSLLLVASLPVWLLAAYFFRWALPLSVVASTLVLAAVVLPTQPGPLVRALDWRPLAALGVASYSLYLWHLPIVDSLERHTGLGLGGLLALSVPVCIAVAVASYLIVERPFLRLRRRWGSTASLPAVEAGQPAPTPPVAGRTAT